MNTATRYQRFADREAAGVSPIYERLSRAVAEQPDLLARIDTLSWGHRQPNLLLAASRHLAAPLDDTESYLEWVRENWEAVSQIMAERYTQTNEPARCATLLPLLARLPQPLALLEVGASAGLCLYPDKYSYRYNDATIDGPDSAVVLECAATGPVPIPRRPPKVVWRAGIDLNPLDVTEPEDLSWLDALIWPEHRRRRDRLRAAAKIAAADPPTLVTGDLLPALPKLAATAPSDATLVIFHSAVLAYLPREARDAFTRSVTALPGHWISNEAAPESVTAGTDFRPDAFALRLDGEPLALTAPHGQAIHWLS